MAIAKTLKIGGLLILATLVVGGLWFYSTLEIPDTIERVEVSYLPIRSGGQGAGGNHGQRPGVR